jgi:hypothetical protein
MGWLDGKDSLRSDLVAFGGLMVSFFGELDSNHGTDYAEGHVARPMLSWMAQSCKWHTLSLLGKTRTLRAK